MKKKLFIAQVGVGVGGLMLSALGHATVGYFQHGYGTISQGMGGTAVAQAQDTFGGANNPATMAFVGNRYDAGALLFSPRRSMSRSGSTGGLDANVNSDRNYFFVPDFGYNRQIDARTALGVTVYGNGGLNTYYPGGQVNCGGGPNTANVLCGAGRLGVDLAQLIIAPTAAFKLDERNSIGIAPLLAYQRFKAEGLQAFANAPGFPPFTSKPGAVSNNGYSSSRGAGVRVGYFGQAPDMGMTYGASYASRIKMKRFTKYEGLFAESGDFDIPENYAVGMTFAVQKNTTVAVEYQRINYSKVASVGNPSQAMAPLGAPNGPGFGWRDVKVAKVGVEHRLNPTLAVRAGYARGTNPVTSDNVTFNILAPGVVRDHFTAGFTQAIDAKSDISGVFMYAKKNSVSGPSLFNAVGFGPTFGGTETVQMKQYSVGVNYSRRF